MTKKSVYIKYLGSYIIEGNLLSVQNGMDFHVASESVTTKYTLRGLVNTGPRQVIQDLCEVLLI